MIKTDKNTYFVIRSLFLNCSDLEDGDIKKEIGYSQDFFESLYNKYRESDDSIIKREDLPAVIKGLEWMLVIRDNSTFLDISLKQGLNLLKLLKEVQNSKSDKITSDQWF